MAYTSDLKIFAEDVFLSPGDSPDLATVNAILLAAHAEAMVSLNAGQCDLARRLHKAETRVREAERALRNEAAFVDHLKGLATDKRTQRAAQMERLVEIVGEDYEGFMKTNDPDGRKFFLSAPRRSAGLVVSFDPAEPGISPEPESEPESHITEPRKPEEPLPWIGF